MRSGRTRLRRIAATGLLIGALTGLLPGVAAADACSFHGNYVDFYLDHADAARARGDQAAYSWYLHAAVDQMAQFFNAGCSL